MHIISRCGGHRASPEVDIGIFLMPAEAASCEPDPHDCFSHGEGAGGYTRSVSYINDTGESRDLFVLLDLWIVLGTYDLEVTLSEPPPP